jgi:hypothetical protein
LDFNNFKSNIFTPENYVDDNKNLFDTGCPADNCPSYMAIYDSLHSLCREQHEILGSNTDLMTLSCAIRALPKLTAFRLNFCEASVVSNRDPEWAESYLDSDMTMAEKSYEHHIGVAANAIGSARNSGVSIRILHLSGFELSRYSPWRKALNLGTLSASLRGLLDQVQVLRLSYSGFPLELLSRYTLNLCELDMCCLTVKQAALEEFLAANTKSVLSIGFHNVIVTSGHLGLTPKRFKLSPELLCSMLKVAPSSTLYKTAGCECPLFRERGWRLLLRDNLSSRS